MHSPVLPLCPAAEPGGASSWCHRTAPCAGFGHEWAYFLDALYDYSKRELLSAVYPLCHGRSQRAAGCGQRSTRHAAPRAD